MTMFHRGLILVGTPLLVGLLLSGSLYLVMQKAESDRIEESNRRQLTSMMAREVVLSTEVVCIAILSIMQEKKELRKLFNDDRAKIVQVNHKLSALLRDVPELVPREQNQFFTAYGKEFSNYVDNLMPQQTATGSVRPAFLDEYQDFSTRPERSEWEHSGGKWIGWNEAQEKEAGDGKAQNKEDGFGKAQDMPTDSNKSDDTSSDRHRRHHRHRHFQGGDRFAEMRIKAQLSSELLRFQNDANQLTRKAQNRLEQSNRTQILLLGTALVLNPIICVALALFYRQGILKRIRIISDNTKSLSLSTPILASVGGNDEIHLLDASFHEMHRQLQEASENERNLFDNASDVICVLDKDNNFLRINPACRKHWQYSPDELCGTNLNLILPPSEIDQTHESINGAKKAASAISFESAIISRSGVKHVALWSTYWSASEEKLFCILHDITEKKKLELMRRQFLSMISAGLKRPLEATVEAISTILADPALPENALKRFSTAKNSLTRLVALVDDLLQVVELEFGTVELNCGKIDLVETVKRSIADVEALAREKSIDLQFDTSAECIAYADSNRTIQVIVNLLSNAIKFSPEGKTIQLLLEQTDAKVICKVKDEGRGIPASKLGLIFEKFGQVELADGRRKAGTGLGLPICKKIVEAQSGEIGVESRENFGSTFWFSLPKTVGLQEAEGKISNELKKEAPQQKNANERLQALEPTALEPTAPHTSTGIAAKREPGFRLPLAASGAILVGIPSIIGLLFAGSLTWSLIDLTNERAAELHQREISAKAFELMSSVAVLANAVPGAPSMFNDSLELHKEHYESTLADLRRLLRGDAESLKYLHKVKNSFDKVRDSDAMKNAFSGADYAPGREIHLLRDLSQYVGNLVVQTRNLYRIIDKAEAVEFRSPERELHMREKESQLLLAGLAANIAISIALSMQFSLGISRRLAIMADNTGRVAREEVLNPVIGGNDELADLDELFHKQAAILVESRRKERAVFDNCKDVLCTLSKDGRFISTNPAAVEMWGYSQSELAEKSILDLVRNEDRDSTSDLLLTSTNGADFNYDCDMVKKDGKIIHCSWSGSRQQDQGALFCVVHDITVRKELEQLRSEFLAIVSHDLRTPLNSVSMSAHMGQEGVFGELVEPTRTLIDGVTDNCRTLLDLICDILDLEKLDSAKMELNFETVSLAQLLDRLCSSVQKLKDQNLELSDDLSDVAFKIDGERLMQSICHIARFMTLQATIADQFAARLSVTRDGLSLSLHNQGPPMPEAIRQHLFERYKDFSLDSLLPANSGFHADLRMPLAAGIIQAHGGNVRVVSGKNGNEYLVFIPSTDATDSKSLVS